jgi:hypothetical protein
MKEIPGTLVHPIDECHPANYAGEHSYEAYKANPDNIWRSWEIYLRHLKRKENQVMETNRSAVIFQFLV